MTVEGDNVMRAQRAFKKRGTARVRRCPICLQVETKGHSEMCANRKRMYQPSGEK